MSTKALVGPEVPTTATGKAREDSAQLQTGAIRRGAITREAEDAPDIRHRYRVTACRHGIFSQETGATAILQVGFHGQISRPAEKNIVKPSMGAAAAGQGRASHEEGAPTAV